MKLLDHCIIVQWKKRLPHDFRFHFVSLWTWSCHLVISVKWKVWSSPFQSVLLVISNVCKFNSFLGKWTAPSVDPYPRIYGFDRKWLKWPLNRPKWPKMTQIWPKWLGWLWSDFKMSLKMTKMVKMTKMTKRVRVTKITKLTKMASKMSKNEPKSG